MTSVSVTLTCVHLQLSSMSYHGATVDSKSNQWFGMILMSLGVDH